jgi:nucleoside-diphosphate-sugar epimerase
MLGSSFHIPYGERVLLTGATGFTGSVLLRKIVESGVKVVAIARPCSNVESFKEFPIEWVRGDVFDPKVIEQAVEGVNYIFHLATPYRNAKLSDHGFYQVHVESTQLLAKAALSQPHFKRFIQVSTVGVHSHIENPPADENYPFAPDDIYQQTKAEAELWIREFAAQSDLPVTVVRPAAIYGPGDRRLLKIFKMVHRQWIPLIGTGDHLYHLIHVNDLANFLIHTAIHPKALGEVFICGNQKAVRFQEMISIIEKHYRVAVKFIKIPASPVFAMADLCETICRPLKIDPPLYRRRVAFFTKDRSFDTSKMRNLLEFSPSYSNEQGLTETAQWYLEKGWLSV